VSALIAGLIVAGSYLLGSVPVAQLAARYTKQVDLRDVGSGNVGASNVWQSVERWLVVPVGLAQIAQGLAGVLAARLADQGAGVQAATGIAAVLAHDWNPWLGFTGGRGIGQTIGVLLGLTWPSLGVFIVVSLAGVVVGWIPQFVALALFAAPFGEIFFGDEPAAAWGAFALAAIAMAKRVLANARPGPELPRPEVWLTRLVYDRDVRDRDAWVRRGLPRRPARTRE
jgi:glycerol-3-phosphate acyltransferase PlsY